MHLRSSLLLLLATTAVLTSSTALALLPPGKPKSECSRSLVTLPPCLSYIGDPPNCSVAAPSVITYPLATTLPTSSDQHTIWPPCEPSECAPSLVALSYIGGPSNHAASAPSDISCAIIYEIIMSIVLACVGYLVWDPLALGFPIDTGRLVELFPSSDACQGINPSPTPCLSYIGGQPYHAASAPAAISCASFYQTIITTGPACVCYLVWDLLTRGLPYHHDHGINPSPTPRLSYIDGPPNHVASVPSDNKTTYPRATTAQLMSSDQHTIWPPCKPSECAPSLVALSYIDGPPNRAALAPSDISYQTIMTTGGACVCYHVWDLLTRGLPNHHDHGINPSPTPRLSYIDGPPNHVASAPSDIKTTYPRATTAQLMSSDQHTIWPPCEPSECAPSLVTLSYIGGPPNRAASAPSDISYQTIMTTGGACGCYLVRDPLTRGLPIDTRRVVAMFPSSDTCRVSSVLSTALPPAQAQRTTATPVCPYMRWRRHLHFEALKYVVYGLLLATNTLNWVLIFYYDVPYKGQSYMYLFSLIISSIPVFLIPSKHFDDFEYIKLVTGIVGTAICLLTDIAVYWKFGHQKVGIGFLVIELTGAIVVRVLGEKAADSVQLISSGTNFVSILIYIVGILCSARWDYVNLEVLSAFLSAAYTALDLIYTCDTPNTVILGVAVLTRILYSILLIFRSHTRGIFYKWYFGNDVEQTGYVAGTRRSRQWREIWRSLVQTYVRPILDLLENGGKSILKILKKAGSSLLTTIWNIIVSIFKRIWSAVCGQEGQSGQGGQGGPGGNLEMT